jgi:PPK2 family polyphosphate:nucleotide phosphotransferase
MGKSKHALSSPSSSPDPAAAAELAGLLKVGEGFKLADVDPGSTPGFEPPAKSARSAKANAEQAMADGAEQVSQLQERLYAAGVGGGGTRSVLLVVQGMDTSGKGGIMRHVVGAVDPQGVQHQAFKAPTPTELAHDFLWRIRPHVPTPGMIGVFDRSHYEDVLIVRVHDLAPRSVWEPRYAAINGFEGSLAQRGTTVLKVMLHISPQEQLRRLSERLVRPDKYWKYNPADLTEHAFWADYQEAYQEALTRCSTDVAPWYVVPADRKWYTRWAVQRLLINALAGIDPQWPAPSFELELERRRLVGLMTAEDVDVPEELQPLG